MSNIRNVFAALCAMTAAGASAAPPLAGEWGGDRAQLTITAAGGRIDYDCGSGTIAGPVRLDAKNRFKASGRHEDYSAGPTQADAAPKTHATTYSGSLKGDTLVLTVKVSGEAKPRTLTLLRGKRVKLIRCL